MRSNPLMAWLRNALLAIMCAMLVSQPVMAQKISAMPAATVPAGTELIPLVQGGVNKAATVNQILASPGLTTALNAASIMPNRRLPNYIVGLGDSRIAAAYLNAAATNRGALSALNWANDLTGARFLIGPMFGVSGERTDQFLARLSSAIATGAGLLYVQGGVNNVAQTSNANTYVHAVSGAVIGSANVAAQAAADLILIADTARAAGMTVVIEAEIGANNLDASQTANVLGLNARLFDYAERTPGVFIHDARPVVLQPGYSDTVSQFKTGFSEDGTHENARGAYYHAKSLAPVLTSIANTPRFGILPRNRYMLPGNGRWQLANNPIFQTASGGTLGANVTGTVPGSCTTAVVAGATMSVAVNADASGYGNNVVLSPTFAAINDAVRFYSDITAANWSPGDIVEGFATISVTGAANLKSVQLELTISGLDAGSVQVGPSTQDLNTGASNSGPDESYTITLRTRTVTIPTSMTTKQFMQIGLRGIAASAASSGATTITILNMGVTRKTVAPYSFGYDLPKLPEAANDNAALEMAA